MYVETASFGGLSFPIEKPEIKEALAQYDFDWNNEFNEEDARLSGDLPADSPESKLTEWVVQRFNQTIVESGMKDPGLDMILDAVQAYKTVKPVSDMVDRLSGLPYMENYWAGKEYHYDAQTWGIKVLPLIGGNTDEYRNRIMSASAAYKGFAVGYDLLTDVYSASPRHQTKNHSLVNLYKVPASFRPAVLTLTEAMSNIVNWQQSSNNGNDTQIQCSGVGCPSDDESDSFSTDFVSDLCYISEEMGDATCYDHTYNPHITGICYLIYCWVYDERARKVSGSGWAWSDFFGNAMGYKPREL